MSTEAANRLERLLLTDCGEFAARHAYHGKLAHFPSSSEIEQGQANDANFFV